MHRRGRGCPSTRRQRCHVLDRVDHAEGIRRRGADGEHGVGVEQRRHVLGVGAQVFARRDMDVLDVEKMRGLHEGGVRGAGDDELSILDAAFGAGFVSRRLHGHEDRFSAAGGHGAADVVAAVEEVGGDGDDVALHLSQRREDDGVEGVLLQGMVGGLVQHAVDFGAGVVDEAPGAGGAVVAVVGLHGAHVTHDVFDGGGGFREGTSHGYQSSVVSGQLRGSYIVRWPDGRACRPWHEDRSKDLSVRESAHAARCGRQCYHCSERS